MEGDHAVKELHDTGVFGESIAVGGMNDECIDCM